ncbi:hypothetical protein EJB05_22679, partial [Eragrostis curvula]
MPTTSSPLADDLGSAPPRRRPRVRSSSPTTSGPLLLADDLGPLLIADHQFNVSTSNDRHTTYFKTQSKKIIDCYKQPPDSDHCGYYTCWFARSSSKYLDRVVELSKRDMEEIRKKRQQKKVLPSKPGSTSLSEGHLLVVVANMCRFLLREVIFPK